MYVFFFIIITLLLFFHQRFPPSRAVASTRLLSIQPVISPLAELRNGFARTCHIGFVAASRFAQQFTRTVNNNVRHVVIPDWTKKMFYSVNRRFFRRNRSAPAPSKDRRNVHRSNDAGKPAIYLPRQRQRHWSCSAQTSKFLHCSSTVSPQQTAVSTVSLQVKWHHYRVDLGVR